MNLDSLTSELFEQIVACLDLKDASSLRLVSRSTAFKATQDTFRSFFRKKHVELTSSSLDRFVSLTNNGGLGCLIEHLSLLGLVYDTSIVEDIVKTGESYQPYDRSGKRKQPCSQEVQQEAAKDFETLSRWKRDGEDLHRSGTDVSLLAKAFANIAACKKCGLQSLSLQVVVYQDGSNRVHPKKSRSREHIFEAASRTFYITIAALRESKLPIQALDVFAKKPESLTCNLRSDLLSRLDLSNEPLAHSLTNLRSLQIGIADLLIVERTESAQKGPHDLHDELLDHASLRASIADDNRYSGLSKLVQVCPDLEVLDISAYKFYGYDKDIIQLHGEMRNRHLHHLARISTLPKLSNLRLAGLHLTESDLVELLKSHRASLRHLELNYIIITEGALASVISYLASMSLETIHLQDLHEQDRSLIHFAGERDRELTKISGDHGNQNIIRRWGSDTREVILFYPYRGMAIGSTRTWARQMRMRDEFGG